MRRPTLELRQRQIRAAQREQRKKDIRPRSGQNYGADVRRLRTSEPKARSERIRRRELRASVRLHEVVLKGDLRVLSDCSNALSQMMQLEVSRIRPVLGDPLVVRVDMQAVTHIDAPGLLFLCSRIETLGKHASVTGNWPVEPQALKALLDARFDRFTARIPTLQRSASVVELIRSERRRDRETVNRNHGRTIQRFLTNWSPDMGQQAQDLLAMAASECIENVIRHAYGNPDAPDRDQKNLGWFVVGLWDAENHRACVSILDQGQGIRATLAPQISRFEDSFRTVGDYLTEATTGALTRTGDAKHGKGLRTLREWVADAPGRQLHVMCDGARILWTDKPKPFIDTVPHFQGTIVCLELSAEPSP